MVKVWERTNQMFSQTFSGILLQETLSEASEQKEKSLEIKEGRSTSLWR